MIRADIPARWPDAPPVDWSPNEHWARFEDAEGRVAYPQVYGWDADTPPDYLVVIVAGQAVLRQGRDGGLAEAVAAARAALAPTPRRKGRGGSSAPPRRGSRFG